MQNPEPYRFVPPSPDRRPFLSDVALDRLIMVGFVVAVICWQLAMMAIGWFARGWLE